MRISSELDDFVVPNPSGCLYFMRGIQKYTVHSKTGGDGVSVSIIFRKLDTGDRQHAGVINLPVCVPWDDLPSLPSIWERDSIDTSADVPMVSTWASRLDFNISRRHTCRFQMLSTAQNIIQTMLVTSPTNIVSADGQTISVSWPSGHSRTRAMEKTMHVGAKFQLYCSTRYFDDKSQSNYMYCGEYKIIGQHHIESITYYLLIKYEHKQ